MIIKVPISYGGCRLHELVPSKSLRQCLAQSEFKPLFLNDLDFSA